MNKFLVAVFLVPLVMALVCSVRAIPEETPLTRQSHNRGGNTARAPQSQSSSLDWLNPFTWFYRGDGERNNEEMKGGGGSSVINVQSQRKILRRRLGLVNINMNKKLALEAQGERPDTQALFSMVSPRQKAVMQEECICRCDCCQCCPCSEELDYY